MRVKRERRRKKDERSPPFSRIFLFHRASVASRRERSKRELILNQSHTQEDHAGTTDAYICKKRRNKKRERENAQSLSIISRDVRDSDVLRNVRKVLLQKV